MTAKQKAILVVDDCPVSRALLVSILSACGYESVQCGSGVQCLDYLERDVPALILLDVSMPDIDGFDLLNQIRHRFPVDALPVLMITANSDGKSVVRGLTTGANDYLVKPIERTSFLARVYNHLSLSQIRRQNDEQRIRVTDLLGVQRAIEELNDEAVFVQRHDGTLIYCNDLMNRIVPGAAAMKADELVERLIPSTLRDDVRRAIAEHHHRIVHHAVSIPPGVDAAGFSNFCTLKTTIRGDLRIWVFQLEPLPDVHGTEWHQSLV
jgi:CheY-like chemotaxis protein